MRIGRFLVLIVLAAFTGVTLWVLNGAGDRLPPVGTWLDPADGLYQSARTATSLESDQQLQIDALDDPVTIVRSERGVPHIFAESDRDATIALGYMVARDRLFQLDFIPRVASGRLAEAFGPDAVSTDRFLRQTGMEWGAQKNLDRVQEERGIEWDLMQWYAAGVNARLDEMDPEELPLEFRLLDYEPDRYGPLQTIRVLQYMSFDLTYRSDSPDYTTLQERLDEEDYQFLYPRHSQLYTPIIPSEAHGELPQADLSPSNESISDEAFAEARELLQEHADHQQELQGTPAEGYQPGKGSNNWAVDATRSTTDAPILAGDMHLSLTLPAIWYEAHLVTPNMNTYGVTVPGSPVLVESFNDHLGWTFTNTGADLIDHYALELDESGTRYRFSDEYRDLEIVPDTIHVNDGDPVVDTLHYSHHGPVDRGTDGAVAKRWVAHDTTRTLKALWKMNRASSLEAFEEGLRYWDAPMQNILYADREGTISIRSTGHLPIRRGGHGVGLLDGTTDAFEWVGRVPFDELPHACNPEQGYLASANQQPTDSTYDHYLGHNWHDAFRSLRIDSLMQSKDQHSVEDLKAYQADVQVVQRDLFVPMIDTLDGLSSRADTLRQMLVDWEGEATVDRPEPLVFDEFLSTLRSLTWDDSAFLGVPRPRDTQLWRLLHERPRSDWLNDGATDGQKTASDVLADALESTAETLAEEYGWGADQWRWGDHHKILFRHLTEEEALRPFWRGPFEYPGFDNTLSPAGGRPTMASASWRVVVDFSTSPPTGYGVYPGGQSGDPLHPNLYDAHLETYLDFEYYELRRPDQPDEVSGDRVRSEIRIEPAE